jgi:hypothetical protein
MTADPLLAALEDAAQRKQQASRDMWLLLAYAREVVAPRPYRLADLAQAAGISISGVRVAYTDADIQQATQLASGCHQRHVEAAVTSLLATRQDVPARERHTAA